MCKIKNFVVPLAYADYYIKEETERLKKKYKKVMISNGITMWVEDECYLTLFITCEGEFKNNGERGEVIFPACDLSPEEIEVLMKSLDKEEWCVIEKPFKKELP